MAVASDLFYHQGYRATGINEVINKSGVAKATFYSHFPTKDDLCLAYLNGAKEAEMLYLQQSISSAEGPLNRFLSVLQSAESWLLSTKFRGCHFINIASEIPDQKSPLRKVGQEIYDYISSQVEPLAEELIASDKEKYGDLDAKKLTNDYMLLFIGAIAMAEIYHAIWPIEHALQTLRSLIGETTG